MSQEHTLLDKVIVARPEQVAADLQGETVILSRKNGVYYGLNEVGTHVWSLIQQPCAVTDIRDSIVAAYEVEPADCEQDLLTLLQQLVAVDLIEVRDAPSC